MSYQASGEDIQKLEAAYKGRLPFHGEMHDHSASGGTSDGQCTLTQWKEEMTALEMDFAAIVDHRQVRHMYLPEWDPTMFVCGSEPGTAITDSKARAKDMHYLMLVKEPKDLEDILFDIPEFKFEGGVEGHFVYPLFTTKRYGELIDTVKAHGGMFVIPHPKQFMFSDDPNDYWFRDWTGIEAVYNSFDSGYTVEDMPLWFDLLKLGKHVWACAGGDKHGHPHDEALTTLYAPERLNTAYFEVYRTGDFTCGAIGIRMICGDTHTGSICPFEGQRLVVSVGDFHRSVKDPTHTYRFDLIDDRGIVFSAPISCEETSYFALDADASRAFYRSEVWDETLGLRISLGNPIWNGSSEESN